MSLPIDIGIPQNEREEIVKGMNHMLADSYTLYLKTHNYHWNVTGPMFQTLHVLFEEHYNELWLAVDELAERIRALGAPSPGSYRQFADLTSIQEADGVPSAMEMVEDLVRGHEAVVRTARKVLHVADAAGDEVTVDMLTQRMTVHEKTAWMLRSLAAG